MSTLAEETNEALTRFFDKTLLPELQSHAKNGYSTYYWIRPDHFDDTAFMTIHKMFQDRAEALHITELLLHYEYSEYGTCQCLCFFLCCCCCCLGRCPIKSGLTITWASQKKKNKKQNETTACVCSVINYFLIIDLGEGLKSRAT